MLDHGATTLTEAWNADPDPSQNHFMLGHIQEWFYSDLAGIQQAEDSVAFQKIVIKPTIVGDITWVRASYDSIAGRIVSNWTVSEGMLSLSVEIPANTTATIFIPKTKSARVLESGLPIDDKSRIKSLGPQDDAAIFQVGSGAYSFTSPYEYEKPSR